MAEKIIDNIMVKIRTDQVKPHPRYYYLVGLIVLIMGTVSLFTVCSFFINAVFYSYSNYRNTFPGIGIQFPWVAFSITLVCFTFGIYLFRKFEISYKRSFLTLLLVIFAVVALLGYLLSRTNLNDSLLKNRAYRRMYMLTLQEEDWVQGTILQVKQGSFLIQDSFGKQFTIVINNKTVLPKRTFNVGDCIKAAGSISDDTLVAKGIGGCGKGRMGNVMGNTVSR